MDCLLREVFPPLDYLDFDLDWECNFDFDCDFELAYFALDLPLALEDLEFLLESNLDWAPDFELNLALDVALEPRELDLA